jgi:hypothetical protein
MNESQSLSEGDSHEIPYSNSARSVTVIWLSQLKLSTSKKSTTSCTTELAPTVTKDALGE